MVITKPIQAGDSRKITFTANYDSAIFTPKLVLSGIANKYEKIGTGAFEINLTATETAEYVAGEYVYSIILFSNDERYTHETGRVNILADSSAAAAGDYRTQNEKILAALDASILGIATSAQLETSINGRSIKRMDPEQLIKLHSHFKSKVREEQNLAKFGKGNRIIKAVL
jgi:hypothetical protein